MRWRKLLQLIEEEEGIGATWGYSIAPALLIIAVGAITSAQEKTDARIRTMGISDASATSRDLNAIRT